MELLSVRIEKPEAIKFILGQTYFIKTVEDLHEALVGRGARNQLGPSVLRGVRKVPCAREQQRSRDDRAGEEQRAGDRREP